MAAISRAVALARGEIVILSDANNVYNKECIGLLAGHFRDPGVGGVCGAKDIADPSGRLAYSEGLYWKYESFIKSQETRLGCCTAASAEVFALRRELFDVPPPSVINDDFYLMATIIRKGFRVIYEPGARSAEPVSASAAGEVARRSRIVAGRYQSILMAPRILPWKRPLLVWQIVSHKFMRPMVPLAMIGAAVSSAASLWSPASGSPWGWLMLDGPWNRLAAGTQCAFYFLALAGSVLPRHSAAGRLAYIPAFLVTSNFAALIGLIRFARGKQSTRWARVKRAQTTTSMPVQA